MKQRHMGARPWGSLIGCLVLCLCLVPAAWAQQTLGTVSVTVLDSTGAVMLNAFNHPVFDQNIAALTNTGFGRGRLMPNTTSRRIEFRANLEF